MNHHIFRLSEQFARGFIHIVHYRANEYVEYIPASRVTNKKYQQTLYYVSSANLLFCLSCFPYLKNNHGNGIMATVRNERTLVAHWYPKFWYIWVPNRGNAATYASRVRNRTQKRGYTPGMHDIPENKHLAKLFDAIADAAYFG